MSDTRAYQGVDPNFDPLDSTENFLRQQQGWRGRVPSLAFGNGQHYSANVKCIPPVPYGRAITAAIACFVAGGFYFQPVIDFAASAAHKHDTTVVVNSDGTATAGNGQAPK